MGLLRFTHRLAQAILMALCAQYSTAAAYTLSAEEAKDIYGQVRYQAALTELSLGYAARHPVVSCDFFGYRVDCALIRRRMTYQADQQRVLRSLRSVVPDEWVELGYSQPAFEDGLLGSTVPDLETVRMATKVVAYIPSMAYDNRANPRFKLRPNTYHYEPRNFFNVQPARQSQLRELRVTISDFEYFVRSNRDTEEPSLFSMYAEMDDILAADEVLGFWERYLAFSQSYDVSKCKDGCHLVVKRDLGPPNTHVLSMCQIISINGVAGAPEDCSDMVLYDGTKKYMKAAIGWNDGQTGYGDGGADDIGCRIRGADARSQLIAQAGAEFEKILRALDTQNRYVIQSKRGSDHFEVVAITRFQPSIFLERKYENSTIRISVSGDDDERTVTASIATSVYVADGDRRDTSEYRGATRAEQSEVNKKLYRLMPERFRCLLLVP